MLSALSFNTCKFINTRYSRTASKFCFQLLWSNIVDLGRLLPHPVVERFSSYSITVNVLGLRRDAITMATLSKESS